MGENIAGCPNGDGGEKDAEPMCEGNGDPTVGGENTLVGGAGEPMDGEDVPGP